MKITQHVRTAQTSVFFSVEPKTVWRLTATLLGTPSTVLKPILPSELL